jgi:ABC-2 type transport system permease protein/oleandomycin transport system permease protein
MTDTAFPAAQTGNALTWTINDVAVVTRRNLIRLMRTPEALFFSSLQPIMFVLLFRYVFAGAIPVPGGSYVNFLMPGIFVQTMCFGAISTAIGLAEDLQTGLLERFRALPMSRAAVLGGRTSADVCRNIFVVGILTAVGFAVGFRPTGGIGNYLLAALLMLLFSYGLMWGFAIIGLAAASAETAQLMSFPLLFPLTFASSAFVPTATMPGWLQAFANNQPVTIAADAARSLMLGGHYSMPGIIWKSVAWSAGIVLVLAPLAIHRYRKMA